MANSLVSGKGDLARLISGKGKNSFDVKVSLKDVKTTEIFSLIEEKTEKKTEAVNTKLGAILNAELRAEGSWTEFRDMTVKGKIERLDIKGSRRGI